MSKKPKVSFACTKCGTASPVWSGRCAQCGEWNSLVEQLSVDTAIAEGSGSRLQTSTVTEISQTPKTKRLSTAITDIDAVLGGGIVPGSVIMIAGQPGIGKSTLLLQVAEAVGRAADVLYVSGEESLEQIGLRAERLGVTADRLELATATITNDIAATLSAKSFSLAIIDSIQTMTCREISSAAGSISQIANSSQLLIAAAKATNTAMIIIGHVTKEGAIAGPKLLEHMVDVVLQLEGDRYGGFKVLRAIKNRFGSTNEAAILEMAEKGLKVVENPSAALLAERRVSDGSVVAAILEGTRPVLVEIQALVNSTSYGYPKRTASGVDLNRLNLLIAVLEKRTKLRLSDKDVYINVVGGIKVSEPAADLAICMAIASAAKGMRLKTDAVVYGEVGLSGEVRHVSQAERRQAEARKLGFQMVIGPKMTKSAADYFAAAEIRDALNGFLTKD